VPDDRLPGDFQKRLETLEADLARLKKPPRDWLEVLKAVAPIVSGLAVAVVGYFLTGAVNNAVQRQQLELSNVREMRELLLKLGNPQAPREEVQATAVTLSAFGGRAVPPLINLLQGGGETKVVAAQEGLRAVGMTDPRSVCEQLSRVIANRTRLFGWDTQLWSIGLVGQLGCVEARPVLEEYDRLLRASSASPDLAPFSRIVRENPAPSPRSLDDLQKALDQSLLLLDQQSTFAR
jgi:hypothetical protein